MEIVDAENENLNKGSNNSYCQRQVVVFPDDEHLQAQMEYESQLDSKLKCFLNNKKRSNSTIQNGNKMMSPEMTSLYRQFPKSEPIYINQQTPMVNYSNNYLCKNVFSSSSSSSTCSTSSSPSISNNNSSNPKLDYDNEDDDTGTPGRRPGRGNRFFPDNVVEILNKWFYENQEYPYPDENMTNALAREANISAKQVRKWFANKRVRSNKCYKQTFRAKLTSTPCTTLKSRRTKSTSEQDLDDCGSDLEMNNSFQPSPQSPPQETTFYENLIRNLQHHQQLNLIQNALYNSTVIANLLQTTNQLNQQTPTSSSSGIIKRKTHLSNRFFNELKEEEEVINTDDTVFGKQQQQQENITPFHHLQANLNNLIQQQQVPKKPKVNFGLISDLIN